MLDIEQTLKEQEEQEELVGAWHSQDFAPPSAGGLSQRMLALYHYNFALWHEEDLARDPDVGDEIIAQVKRNIDTLNQKRNDMIERVDESILEELSAKGVSPRPGSRMNTETPGSALDRLFINALKIYHMTEESERTDASEEHWATCRAKRQTLKLQRADLGASLSDLMEDLKDGSKHMKVYRQMKMYNDETLNPVLYRKDIADG